MTSQIVGVIFSRADLERALRLRRPPDLFELRLDRFAHCLEEVSEASARLPAPFIITARDPREGGANNLPAARRRAILLEFLPRASWIDVELRSARLLAPVLRAARAKDIAVIISFHDFRGTPSAARLDEIVHKAHSLGPTLVKIATRTDTPGELQRLLEFFKRTRNVAVMGMGKFGRRSRLELVQRGCVLNYAHLATAQVAGQLSIPELRRAFG